MVDAVRAFEPYAKELAGLGGLNLDQVSLETKRSLAAVGIRDSDLARIAGADRAIRGEDFGRIFALLEAKSGAGAGKTPDLARAEHAYRSLRSDVERAVSEEGGFAIERRRAPSDRSGYATAGLRSEMGRLDQKAPPARPTVTFAPNDLPALRPDEAPPEEPCWFVKMLEFLFQWIPGVTTHEMRLEKFGRDLADRHGSDIRAFKEAYARRPQTDGAKDATSAMEEALARDFRSRGLDPEAAASSAKTVIAAMNAQLESNGLQDAARIGSIPDLDERGSTTAKKLSEEFFDVEKSAASLGGMWPTRVKLAMIKPPLAHPVVQAHLDKRAEAENAVRTENLRTVSYLMAMERSGGLTNVPEKAVDALLKAQQAGLIDSEAVAETVNALQTMKAEDRDALLTSIDSVKGVKRETLWATLAREHYGLRSSDPEALAGVRARIELAVEQLDDMDPDAAFAAFEEGTLGLIAERDQKSGVPIFFHPSISEAKRETYRKVIAEAYALMPKGAVAAMLAGEGGPRFNVQILRETSIESGLPKQHRPNPASPLGGFIQPADDKIRLNADEIDRRRGDAVGYVLHESSHYLDDLGDKDKERGFFIDLDVARAQQRTRGDGDLAPSWAHFHDARASYRKMMNNVGDPEVTAWLSIGQIPEEKRSDKQKAFYEATNKKLAGISGNVSEYGALGGDGTVKSVGVQMAEWWAETNASFLNPKRRDQLKAADPVAFQAAKRYNELLGKGVHPTQAMREALRFSLSTEVAAKQGLPLLKAPLFKPSLDALNGIADAFEQHGTALDGWRPFLGNAGLIEMRKGEALRGVEAGKALLEKIDARLAKLDAGSPERAQLATIRARLATAVSTLEQRAGAL